MGMNNGPTYYQLIPEKVYNCLSSINELLKSEIKGYSPDNTKEVISTIAYLIRKEKGPVPVAVAYLNKLVPQGQWYLKGLIDLGIIRRSGQFIPGETCYRYEFTPEYQSRYISIILNNPRLKRRINKVWDEMRRKDLITTKGRSEQIKYLKLLTIDKEYREYLDSHLTQTRISIIAFSPQRCALR
jgi:hypothetical protein